jgi:hypothetical protein
MIDESFLRGDRDLTKDDLGPYLEPLGKSMDLSPIDDRIAEIEADEEVEPQRSQIDAELAPTLHRTLSLSRYEAADAGLWHYLCIVRFTDFVRYRWEDVWDPEKPSNLEEKFLAAGADIYSNALHRLWWAAELTYEEAESGSVTDRDYDRTRRVLEFQELANDIFDRWFARYKPVAVACVDLLEPETLDELKAEGSYPDAPSNSQLISDTTTLLREELTVRRVEAMDDEDIRETIRTLREEVMQGEHE